MAGQGGARQQRTLRTAGGISGTTEDVDEDRLRMRMKLWLSTGYAWAH